MTIRLMPFELSRAIQRATEIHEKHTDNGGRPYALHVLDVMYQVLPLGDDFAILGVSHDTIEDGYKTNPEVGFKAFNAFVTDDEGILADLRLLTHDKTQPYMEYVKAISASPRATAVKIADLKHNTLITRLKGITQKDIKRMEKYHAAYLFLTGQSDKLLASFDK